MKRILSLLIANAIISTSSFSVISCNLKYENKFNSIIDIIEKVNDAPLIDYNINTNFSNPNTIFAIKNALGLSINDMNYVNLQLLNTSTIKLNTPIELEINIKVLDYKKSFIKNITVSNNITSNISSVKINSINTFNNDKSFLSTNNGLYIEKTPFSFKKITSTNDLSIYSSYQSMNGTIYIATNKGLFYSSNGINFYKNNYLNNDSITQIIQSNKNNYIYVNTKTNGLYVSTDNGITFQNIPTSLTINNIKEYNNELYVCTNNSIYILDGINLSDDSDFNKLSNISDIEWISKNTAYLISSDEIWYYKKYINNFVLLKHITISKDSKELGNVYSVTNKISNIKNFIFISTSNGLFYIDDNSDVWNLATYNFGYFKINSLFPYSIYINGDFNGLKIFIMPINDILKGE